MAAIPSSSSLVATHDYYRHHLGSTASNSSCGSTKCPAEAIPHPLACFSGSLPSLSWPRCWSPRSTWNSPRPAEALGHQRSSRPLPTPTPHPPPRRLGGCS
ncbi:pancreatic progenitor cell differentiation and proliferation factor-like [Aotus nancymaae]|uniref:pancreatic progenitor cell differentiation and proliferation factor-like n=1 Tax=Aotus nancymaae TaxID=37293 RepID=UPI0030FE0E0F